MLSLLNNKNAGKSEAGRALPWHPNFRNESQLPDIKTVRTKFFVNIVAITIVVVLALFVVLRELKLSSLGSDLAEVDRQIAEATKPSERAIADFKIYQEQEKRFNDAYSLVKDPFRYADLLIHLGSILPRGVKIKRVDFRGSGQPLAVSASVKGVDAAASDIASEFVKKLQADAFLLEHFSAVTLMSLGRNVDEGNMGLELNFVFKSAAKTPATK